MICFTLYRYIVVLWEELSVMSSGTVRDEDQVTMETVKSGPMGHTKLAHMNKNVHFDRSNS